MHNTMQTLYISQQNEYTFPFIPFHISVHMQFYSFMDFMFCYVQYKRLKK